MKQPAWLPRITAVTRKLPAHLLAFVAIAVAIVITHWRYLRMGITFNDASWYFHFGKRFLDGDVPYRDYLFQVGPLPIYVDAAFQKLFGTTFLASLYAGLLIKIVRVFVSWAIARRIAGRWPALAIALFCAVDPAFAFVYHWSTPYAELFVSLSGLCLLLAIDRTGRGALVWLFLAGMCLGLVVSARQSSAIMLAIVGLACTGILLWRKELFTPQRFAAMWGGFAVGFLIIFAVLALQGALGPAIQQMFLDAPQKKGISGIDMILDPLSGGALIHARFDSTQTWYSCLFYWLGIPLAITGAMIYIGTRKESVTPQAIAVLVLPLVIIVGLLTRYGEIGFFNDLPRTALTVVLALAVFSPNLLRSLFGIEPVVAFALGGLPLALDWAMELSNLGRGWGDPPALLVGVLLLPLASNRIGVRAKQIVAAGFAFVACVHLVSSFRQHFNPLGSLDGTPAQTRFSVKHPMLKGIRMNKGRKLVLDWLRKEIQPGSTCFIYGNMPVLYTLLDCKNPTLIDTTAADFLTGDDADQAMATLEAHPPDYIIGHELAFMNPSLRIEERPHLYDGMNPRASRSLHRGVRRILDHYEDVGFAADIIGPTLAAITHTRWDAIDQVRLYRRTR